MIPSGVSDFPVQAEDIRRLARLVELHQLSELRFEEDDLRITLRTTPPGVPATSAVAPVAPALGFTAPAPTASVAEPVGKPIEAPIMGIFYRSPAPGSPSFVEVGDLIEAGQPVGMIEAMKTFSEVLAEFPGRVAAVPAENGKMVQPGDALVLVAPE